MNQLETKKKFQLVERVLCALYAYLGFFHQGHGELANLEPSMRDLQHQLRLSRREFAKQSRIAEAKRMQLEVHLSSALKVKGKEIIDGKVIKERKQGFLIDSAPHKTTGSESTNGA